MKKRRLAGLMTHQYKKIPVTMKMWMQLNAMPRTCHWSINEMGVAMFAYRLPILLENFTS